MDSWGKVVGMKLGVPKRPQGQPNGPICKKRAKSIDVQHSEIPTLLHFLVNLWRRGKCSKNINEPAKLPCVVGTKSYPIYLGSPNGLG